MGAAELWLWLWLWLGFGSGLGLIEVLAWLRAGLAKAPLPSRTLCCSNAAHNQHRGFRPGSPPGRGPMTLHLVQSFNRIGEENAFAVLARATELQRQGKDIINLGIGQPDFRTPDHIVEAAIKALRDGHHGYTPATGILPLREAVAADLHKRFQVNVDPDLVMIMPGGKVTMFMAILMFGEPGVDILYPDPGFPIYRSMIEFTGANPIPVPIREENGFAFSADETLSLITPKTRLLILNSPANPTGGVTPKAEIDKLVAGLAQFPDVAIMSDEIYAQMTYDGLAHQTLLAYPDIRDRLILLDGWSKTYAMTGWRMGYSIWPKLLYDAARKLAVNSFSCVNASAQYAGLAALTGPQDEVHKMVAEFDRRRKIVVEGLNALPNVSCAVPKGAFYAFPNVSKTGWKAKKLASALLEETGVATIGGPDFGVYGEGYIRLSYANSAENIRRALGRMNDFLVSTKPQS
jgi:aspartate aminotransferase